MSHCILLVCVLVIQQTMSRTARCCVNRIVVVFGHGATVSAIVDTATVTHGTAVDAATIRTGTDAATTIVNYVIGW